MFQNKLMVHKCVVSLNRMSLYLMFPCILILLNCQLVIAHLASVLEGKWGRYTYSNAIGA